MGLLLARFVLLGFCATAVLPFASAGAETPHADGRDLALLRQPDARLKPEAGEGTAEPAQKRADAGNAIPMVPSIDVWMPKQKTPANAPPAAPVSEAPAIPANKAPIAPVSEAPAAPANETPVAEPVVEVPTLPEIEISLPDAQVAPPPAAAPQTVNLDAWPLPPPPQMEAVFTADDRLANALATHIADHGDGKGVRLNPRLPKDVRQDIADYYEGASFHPLWISNGAWTPAALSLREQLARAADDALDPADYPVPDLSGSNDPEALAQAEISLSAAAILYARDARGGRLNPARLSKNITPDLQLPKPAEVLAVLASSSETGKALEGFNPQHPGYLALKKKLAEVREAIPSHTMQEVPRGPTIKVGMRDERVPLLRARFGLGATEQDQDTYDAATAAAIASFQKDRGLKASGDLNDRTVLALGQTSDNPRRMEADLIANMERWRWLPTQMGERYIQVNVPEYELRIVTSGSVVKEARVIVGKAGSPTPIFSGAMQTVVVNPSWNIPPSIMKNEILPGLAKDPDYAAKRGYQVTQSRNGRISVRQPPGARNALGYIKFLFPNQHAVYLHDTPNRNLFSASKRAFSHGCVRVDEPFLFAEEVLGRESWPLQKMRGLIGKGERTIKLETPLPVHLTYFTLSVDENGDLKRFDDIYGFNRQVRDALGLKG